ncbi:MAG: hypothetical protein U1F35_03320 [Steroidobacteraceae bacterium]
MRPVHLVGSIGLPTVDDVFATAGGALGQHLHRCPDGEVGGRRLWISWQWPLLRAAHFLEVGDQPPPPDIGIAQLRIQAGTADSALRFGELGYAREARASYIDFLAARERGELPATCRFQVSLPTPTAVIGAFVVAEDVERLLPAYTQAMIAEARRVFEAIPHHDLAMQWDVCFEMLQWDARLPHMPYHADTPAVFARRFRDLCSPIPAEVELGFHLCYGDMDGKHGIEPLDLAKAVSLANLLCEHAGRIVHWMHMPVPIDRDDDAYFAPLAGLRLHRETQLFLGLVHAGDGVEGTARRMRVAARHAPGFGIATECGMGRARSPEAVRELLQVHAKAAEQLPG